MRSVINTTLAILKRCLVLSALIVFAVTALQAQRSPDPRYQTRVSDCRHEPPPGRALLARRVDSPVSTRGYAAERLLTQIADTRGLSGGEVVVCSEFGRVEIVDSDDGQVRLQVRIEAFGEGSSTPATAAKQVIEATKIHTYLTAHQGRLMVRVWHSTLGFSPGSQPAVVNVRLQLPARGAYNVTLEAFHGAIAIRRLTLGRSTLRGNVSDKFKGIPGYIGLTELDNVELAGEVDINNLAGLPGIRPPVSSGLTGISAPILIKARAGANSKLTAVTGGNVNIVIQPNPDVGVRVLGEAKTGQIAINIEDGQAEDVPDDSDFPVRGVIRSPDFETKRVKLEVHAVSNNGNVNVASIPAAPFVPARP